METRKYLRAKDVEKLENVSSAATIIGGHSVDLEFDAACCKHASVCCKTIY